MKIAIEEAEKDDLLMDRTTINQRYLNYIIYVLIFVVIMCLFVMGCNMLLWNEFAVADEKNNMQLLNRVPAKMLSTDADVSRPRNSNCRFWNCFNPYRCGQNGQDHLTIYVYPFRHYVDESNGKHSVLTREYYQILESVVKSKYYTSNPNEACLFLPSIDILNQHLMNTSFSNRALASLDNWDDGRNHIIITMLPQNKQLNNQSELGSDNAMILGGGFNTQTYRSGFDVVLPVWSPLLQNFEAPNFEPNLSKKYKLLIPQIDMTPKVRRVLVSLAQDNPLDVLLLHNCSTFTADENDVHCNGSVDSSFEQQLYEYPKIMENSTFCLINQSPRMGHPEFIEMLAYNCIPVVALDNCMLPFEEIIDWSLATVRIRELELHVILKRLSDISADRILYLQRQVNWLYTRYFKDLKSITMTALIVLESRIFPQRVSFREKSNLNIYDNFMINPLFLSLMPVRTEGFTAVILTYDRIESLFTLIKKLSLVPSLESVLVIWNNQRKQPPHPSTYPVIAKPLKIIQTRANKLSNRFYPYDEIATEAILTIDDDIVMLTTDEVEFGYEVWREFPDRIVGFPSRLHVWDNSSKQWQYDSEWTNQISMILTGAAFHHKFWNHVYTYAMPGTIKEWVDEHMNCEDIAMNFLVANITKKSPIKVTPRKKFKCPECINTEMLSADLNHMRERSACIDQFAKVYGRMPLRNVEFRADPVLFKDNFPNKLKRFNDIGSM